MESFCRDCVCITNTILGFLLYFHPWIHDIDNFFYLIINKNSEQFIWVLLIDEFSTCLITISSFVSYQQHCVEETISVVNFGPHKKGRVLTLLQLSSYSYVGYSSPLQVKLGTGKYALILSTESEPIKVPGIGLQTSKLIHKWHQHWSTEETTLLLAWTHLRGNWR